MHKTRIFTGLALSALALFLILGLSTPVFAWASLIIILVGAGEWAALTGVDHTLAQGVYIALIAGLAACAWWSVSIGLAWIPVIAGAVWWFCVAVLLVLWRPDWAGHRVQAWLRVAGLPTLVLAWLALVLIHRYDAWLLVFLIVLAALGDTAAYFVGKHFGRHRMAPLLSPGKTWEGLLGELSAALLASLVGAYVFAGGSLGSYIAFVLLAMLSVLASVCGDLFESLLKRVAGAKDSGHLLPGHGGVLDRVDSHLAAAPIFLLGLMWLFGGNA